jgi:hypothetical protein
MKSRRGPREQPPLKCENLGDGAMDLLSPEGRARRMRGRTAIPADPSINAPHSRPVGLPTHSSPMTPRPSSLVPHASPLSPHSSRLSPISALLTPRSPLLNPHSSILAPRSSHRTPAPPCPILSPLSPFLSPLSSIPSLPSPPSSRRRPSLRHRVSTARCGASVRGAAVRAAGEAECMRDCGESCAEAAGPCAARRRSGE